MSLYQERIAGLTSSDPRHVEAFMRLEHGTLDQLSPARFTEEVFVSALCVAEAGPVDSEALAVSYGL
jgi:hypothetical protein